MAKKKAPMTKLHEKMEKKDGKVQSKHKDHKKKSKAAGARKVSKVLHEFKEGKLHSGSKKGPEVTNKKQAVAIALSEARKAGAHIPKKKKK